MLGPDVELAPLVDVPGVRTDENDPFIRTVFELVERRQGRRPAAASAPYFTDASIPHPGLRWNPPTVILGPGELVQAHQTDEYAEVRCIEETTELYRELGRRFCGS